MKLFALVILMLVISACAVRPVTHLSTTATLTMATQTSSPEPIVLLPSPTTTLRINAPSPAPAGFEWADLADFNYLMLVPHGWFVKQVFQGNTEAIFITREDIEVTGRYSTGLGINIIQNVDNVDNAAQSFIQNIANQKTTTKILDSAQMTSKTKTIKMYVIVIEAELPVNPNDPVPTPYKTLAYHAIADTETNTIFTMIFESPRNQWESEWNEHGAPLSLPFIDSVFSNR
jgi:hypothetical protein